MDKIGELDFARLTTATAMRHDIVTARSSRPAAAVDGGRGWTDRVQARALAIVPDRLDQVAALAAEYEQVAAMGLAPVHLLDD